MRAWAPTSDRTAVPLSVARMVPEAAESASMVASAVGTATLAPAAQVGAWTQSAPRFSEPRRST